MSFKGALLDLDNTIYSYDDAHRAALGYLFKHMSDKYALEKSILENAYEIAKADTHQALAQTASSHNKLLYFQKICETINLRPLSHALDFYEIYWEAFLKEMRPYENVYDFLDLIKDMKICLVSDLTAHTQLIKIRRLDLFKYLSAIVTSEEVGREKPDPSIFLAALKKIKMRAEDVCAIGDNYNCDIAGAKKLGIKSFWLNRQGPSLNKDPLVTPFKNFKELMTYFHG